ncbi:hypothetical protein [Nocardia sp. XZ_19_385]|uniref:hypothetical protein n=1 Tax=Nocardia sp. XZ_19_385 TaxID=2769488 RepID=UPI00188E1664|nr:hypothetical protein [Nocardia sp. XZ_19_385]
MKWPWSRRSSGPPEQPWQWPPPWLPEQTTRPAHPPPAHPEPPAHLPPAHPEPAHPEPPPLRPEPPLARPVPPANTREHASQQLSLIESFLERAHRGGMQQVRQQICTDLADAAAYFPDHAIRLIPLARRRFTVADTVVQTILGSWLRSPDPDQFPRTWTIAEELMQPPSGGSGTSTLCTWFATTLRSDDPPVSPEFRSIASSHLAQLVDDGFEKLAFVGGTSVLWQVLYALGPSSRADWLRLMGDRAADRGEKDVAQRRHQLADRFTPDADRNRLVGQRRAESRDGIFYGSGPRIGGGDALAGIGSGKPAFGFQQPDSPFLAPAQWHPGPVGPPEVHRGTSRAEPEPPEPVPPDFAEINRRILLAAADIIHGKPPAGLAELLRQPLDRTQHRTAVFLDALADLRAGQRDQAHTKLRTVIDGPASVDSDDDLVANAHLILGVLDMDGEQVAAGLRLLAGRHRDNWPSRSMVDPDSLRTVLVTARPLVLADLILADPSVLGVLAADGRALHLQAARGLLAKAAWAVLLSQTDAVNVALAQAIRLLDTVRDSRTDELREIAARLEGFAHPNRPVTQPPLDLLGLAALRVNGTIQPWTESALDLWRAGRAAGGSTHHAAIAEHARAYQAELDNDDQAFSHWNEALHHWAQVYENAEFWSAMRTHLGTVLPEVPRQEIADAVAQTRAELPANLLEPHVTRIRALWRSTPDSARAHMEVIRNSELPTAATAAARAKLSDEADALIREEARSGRPDDAIDIAATWLHIDPDSARITEAALDVGIGFAESQPGAPDSIGKWAAASWPLLQRIATLIPPSANDDHAAFAGKLARHEFWLGLYLFVSAQRTALPEAGAVEEAADHLERAKQLGLPTTTPYDQANTILTNARELTRWAKNRNDQRNQGFGFHH